MQVARLLVKLGKREFTDGIGPSAISDDGRQYVLDDNGEPVYGVWLHPDVYGEPVTI